MLPQPFSLNQAVRTRIVVQKLELSISFDGIQAVANLPIPAFQPSRSWRMALGARNGVAASGLEVRDMNLAASPHLDSNAVAVEVTANENDFTGDGVQLSYLSPPSLSSITPGSGSNRGGTSLTLTGDHLRGGDAYRIALQSSGATVSNGTRHVVRATYSFIDGRDALVCTTPEHPAGHVWVYVSLNAQQFQIALGFVYFNEPWIDSLRPSSGPVEGGTLVRIRGITFVGGSMLLCRFGGQAVPAQLGPASEDLWCRLPRGLKVGRARLALNPRPAYVLSLESPCIGLRSGPCTRPPRTPRNRLVFTPLTLH